MFLYIVHDKKESCQVTSQVQLLDIPMRSLIIFDMAKRERNKKPH